MPRVGRGSVRTGRRVVLTRRLFALASSALRVVVGASLCWRCCLTRDCRSKERRRTRIVVVECSLCFFVAPRSSRITSQFGHFWPQIWAQRCALLLAEIGPNVFPSVSIAPAKVKSRRPTIVPDASPPMPSHIRLVVCAPSAPALPHLRWSAPTSAASVSPRRFVATQKGGRKIFPVGEA